MPHVKEAQCGDLSGFGKMEASWERDQVGLKRVISLGKQVPSERVILGRSCGGTSLSIPLAIDYAKKRKDTYRHHHHENVSTP